MPLPMLSQRSQNVDDLSLSDSSYIRTNKEIQIKLPNFKIKVIKLFYTESQMLKSIQNRLQIAKDFSFYTS